MSFYIGEEIPMSMKQDSTESTNKTIENQQRFLGGSQQEPRRRSEVIQKLVHSDVVAALVFLAMRWLL